MVRIFIENQPYDADGRMNLLQACLSLGFNVPYFCWHPALGSVGACRQCAVKQFRDEHDHHGKIVMSCMTPVTEGLRISINDAEVIQFRKSIIEFLMTNHPHDCPVCDEGGHCHLQDMTMMTGHSYRRFRFPKRTFRNQYLGPFLNHEMNRCIECYRCVRFYGDYAGGHDLNVFAAHNHVYFGRAEDGVLESPFSGNLAEVCPTGVFTDKTLGTHYTRKWDLQMAPSICTNCGVGCNITPGERYGMLRRIENRFNGHVNRYFNCDRGRYGYEFVNHASRIRQPLVREGAAQLPVSKAEALHRMAGLIKSAKGVIGIGSPRASLEDNFALRSLVGAEHFFSGMESSEHALVNLMIRNLRGGPARSPSLSEIEGCDALLILGEDLTNTAPMMALAVRQAVRNQPMEAVRKLKIPEWLDAAARNAIQDQRGPCTIATPAATPLDEAASRALRLAPAEVARLGFAVARALAPGAPEVTDLNEDTTHLAAEIAQELVRANRPLVIAGPSLASEAIVQAAATVAWALSAAGKPAALSYTAPECNSLGVGLMDARPLDEALDAVREGRADTVIVLENDLARRLAPEALEVLFQKARVIALDSLLNATAARAGLALPAGTFAESDGTYVNHEGRAQRFYQVFVPGDEIIESWRWLRDGFAAAGRGEDAHWPNLDALMNDMAAVLPVFAAVPGIAPPADFRIAGCRINREPHRYSGRTAMYANVSVHEPKPPDDPDSPLAFSMEGVQSPVPAPLIPFFWAPGWNSTMQAFNKFQDEVGGPLRGGDPGRRLIEPQPEARPEWPAVPHAASAPSPGALFAVPFYHIFGSEELSVLTPGIRERSPAPYVALGPEDFSALGLAEDEPVEVVCGALRATVRARLEPTLPRGLAGLPMGLPEMPGPLPGGECRVAKVKPS